MATIVDVLLRRDAIARAFGDDRSVKGFERLQEIVAEAPDLITQAQTTATDAQTKTNALKASVQFVVMSATGLTAAERVLTAGTGLGLTDGGAGGNATLALANTAVAAGAYGDATHVGTFTVDAQGRLIGAASVAITFPAGGATAFTGLSDAPASYSGQALKAVRVNPGATALEFYTPSTGSGDLISTNNLSDVANAGTALTNLGLSANGKSLVTAANYSAMRVLLTLVPGTDVQAWDADLDALAALSGTNTIYYRSAANTWSAVTIGTGLSFSAGTLAATGGGGSGTVTASGSPTSGFLAKWTSATDITKGDLSGDISTSGSLVTTIGSLKVATGMIQASAVTLAKIANASANSKLVGSGASGSGSAYAEITLGAGLSMSGTTLSTTASSNTSSYTGSGAVVYFASNLAAGATGNVTIAFDTSLYNDTVDPGDGGGVQRFWLGANKTASVASTTLETLTITAHGLTTGEGPFFFTTTTTLPGGMSAATKYWAIVVDANTISLATSRANALAATKVDITSSGTGTHTLNTGPFLIVPKGVSRIQVGASIADTGSAIAVNLLVLKNGSSSYAGILRQDTSTPATQGGNAAGPPIPVSEGDYFEMQFNVFSADTLVALTTWFSILAWK